MCSRNILDGVTRVSSFPVSPVSCTEAMKHSNIHLGKNCSLNFNPATLASVHTCLNSRVVTSVSRWRPENSHKSPHCVASPQHKGYSPVSEDQNHKIAFLNSVAPGILSGDSVAPGAESIDNL